MPDELAVYKRALQLAAEDVGHTIEYSTTPSWCEYVSAQQCDALGWSCPKCAAKYSADFYLAQARKELEKTTEGIGRETE